MWLELGDGGMYEGGVIRGEGKLEEGTLVTDETRTCEQYRGEAMKMYGCGVRNTLNQHCIVDIQPRPPSP